VNKRYFGLPYLLAAKRYVMFTFFGVRLSVGAEDERVLG